MRAAGRHVPALGCRTIAPPAVTPRVLTSGAWRFFASETAKDGDDEAVDTPVTDDSEVGSGEGAGAADGAGEDAAAAGGDGDAAAAEDADDGEEASGDDVTMAELKPREVVSQLNRHIIGQDDAKRAVAIALRNRWRRLQLPAELQPEVTPKNILMVGPTGCGKTEVARRLANLVNAPFIKVEATKFTEVGFHGRDVDMIIRDLVEVSSNLTTKTRTAQLREEVKAAAEDKVLELLCGTDPRADTLASFRKLLRSGELNERTIEVDVPVGKGKGGNGVAVDLSSGTISHNALQDMFSRVVGGGKGKPTERQTLTIEEAIPVLEEAEMEAKLESMDVMKEAIKNVEQNGIVFIDEIDKITSSSSAHRGPDASAEGVQRDLLPLVEGSIVNTKHGNVSTDHILFIASGAFHSVKPSDLLPELQGRLPIRVQLNALTEEDLRRILTEPESNLIRQQVSLISTEGVTLTFTDEAVAKIAKMAADMNRTVENIGARRLQTVMERLVEDISFDAADMEPGSEVTVDADLVQERLGGMLKKADLSKFIL